MEKHFRWVILIRLKVEMVKAPNLPRKIER